MVTPRIDHLSVVTVIDTYPTVKDPGHHFQKENDNKLGLAQTGTDKKRCFGGKPGKQNKVNSE